MQDLFTGAYMYRTSSLPEIPNKIMKPSEFYRCYNDWGYSSVVEHLTADQEVPGSNPGAPFSTP